MTILRSSWMALVTRAAASRTPGRRWGREGRLGGRRGRHGPVPRNAAPRFQSRWATRLGRPIRGRGPGICSGSTGFNFQSRRHRLSPRFLVERHRREGCPLLNSLTDPRRFFRSFRGRAYGTRPRVSVKVFSCVWLRERAAAMGEGVYWGHGTLSARLGNGGRLPTRIAAGMTIRFATLNQMG